MSNLLLCMRGTPEQAEYLPEICKRGAGLELGSYGLAGIYSDTDWESRLADHTAIRNHFHGFLAVHGPFIGMEYAHRDHLLRAAVNHRLDRFFNAAVALNANRVVLHSGYKREIELFHLQEFWHTANAAFWQQEIIRWERANIQIVIENETEQSPEALVNLIQAVNSTHLGLCLDIGHHHLFATSPVEDWIEKMGTRLWHVHLHDNDRVRDRHWPIGRGIIDFESFYAALLKTVPNVTLSLEVEDDMAVKMDNLRALAERFCPCSPNP